MGKEHYISPSVEVISLEADAVIASSPYATEGIDSSGEIIEWGWY